MDRIIKLMPRFVGDLEYCQNKNWNSPKQEVRDRANLMFSRIRNELGELAHGLQLTHISNNQYKYTFTDGFATIYITAIKDSNNQECLCIDDVNWHYKTIDWWNIIEQRKIDGIIAESINKFLKREVIK